MRVQIADNGSESHKLLLRTSHDLINNNYNLVDMIQQEEGGMGVVVAADESEDPDIDINQLHEFKHVQNHRDELLLNLQNKLKRQRRPSS